MLNTSRLPSVVAISVIIYIALAASIFFAILHKTGGTFVYALDDPYIHLAMAEQIAHGHYGINPAEPSSPSSSLIWPLLLVPFAGHAIQAYLPLFWNLLFGIAAAALIGLFADRLPFTGSSSHPVATWLQKIVAATLLIFVANLASLTFLGMEHVLQILLTVACAIGILAGYDRRSIPTWCLAAAIIGPSVRYENIAITVAVAIALIGLNQARRAAALIGLAVLPLIAFSVFLKQQGLPILPVSVLMKRNISFNPMLPNPGLFRTLLFNLAQDIQDLERLAMLVLLAVVVVLVWRDRLRWQRFDLLGAGFVALSQLLIGKFGWFHRYQVYAIVFVALILLRSAARLPRIVFIPACMLLLFCAAPFLHGTWQTPGAAASVYEQQYQMHRFVNDFYRHDVAVNDLGMVSYQRPPGLYVLDIYGLASPEVARETSRTSEWLQGVVERHNVSMVIIYPELFEIPSDWTPLAMMCRPRQVVRIGQKCVTFYNTSSATVDDDRAALARFAPTVPSAVTITLYPAPSGEALN